jgi:hypothetical protein
MTKTPGAAGRAARGNLPMEDWNSGEQGIMDPFERTDQALALLEAGLPR